MDPRNKPAKYTVHHIFDSVLLKNKNINKKKYLKNFIANLIFISHSSHTSYTVSQWFQTRVVSYAVCVCVCVFRKQHGFTSTPDNGSHKCASFPNSF